MFCLDLKKFDGLSKNFFFACLNILLNFQLFTLIFSPKTTSEFSHSFGIFLRIYSLKLSLFINLFNLSESIKLFCDQWYLYPVNPIHWSSFKLFKIFFHIQ